MLANQILFFFFFTFGSQISFCPRQIDLEGAPPCGLVINISQRSDHGVELGDPEIEYEKNTDSSAQHVIVIELMTHY